MDEDRLHLKLAPESVATTLIRAGSFLSAYELIKSEIVDKVHGFFWCGFKDGDHVYDEDAYHRSVLSRNPGNKYLASCNWLLEMQALTAEQVAALSDIRTHRHEIAHELPRLLVDPDVEVRGDLLVQATEIVRGLGVFWGSIEVDTDPEFDGEEVDYNEIKSGSFLLMEYLVAIAGLASVAESNEEMDEKPTT